MGFTPLEGLIMSTRPGDVDAGAILHMARQGRSSEVLARELNRESGLLGLSGASDDVRELVALDDTGHAGARLALAAFCHRIRKYIGAYAAVLGGLVNHSGITWQPPSSSESVLLHLKIAGENATIFGTTVGLVIVAVLSAWWPSYRAARLNVVEALRHA